MNNNAKKLCVFPNDSLKSYFVKGEIKESYFNPENYFDEIHVISLFDEEIDKEDVKELAGNAIIKIHKIGKVNLSNYKKFYDKIFHVVNEINPLLIRAYNPLIQGWVATKIAKRLGVPIIISIHTNYDEQRQLLKKQKKLFSFFKLQFTVKKIEKYVLEEADAVICVYQHIVPYVKRMGANNIHVIYNRVNFEHFSPEIKQKITGNKPIIISVGRLMDQKNQMYLLEAITNKELGGYYTSCDIYAQVLENLEGVPIPVLEAMACGLPVVISNHDTSYSEIIDDAVIFSKNSKESFTEAFERLLTNPKLSEKLKRKSLEVIQNIDGKKMEKKEFELYHNLIETRKEKT